MKSVWRCTVLSWS